MLKVSSGENKGAKLTAPAEVRPTKAIVKNALFNILRHHDASAENKIFLDVFAGAGSVGIEAISNGFICVFIEKFKSVFEILKKNLLKNKLPLSYYQFSALKKIARIRKFETNALIYGDALKIIDEFNCKFDIIFIDPPYDSNLAEKIITSTNLKSILTDNGLIIVETSKKEFHCPETFTPAFQKKYGETYLYFFKHNNYNLN